MSPWCTSPDATRLRGDHDRTMSANAVLSPGPRPNRPTPERASQMVHLIRESWAGVETRSDEVARFFYAMLFSIAPHTRELFAANMESQRDRLMRALVHIIQMIDRPDDITRLTGTGGSGRHQPRRPRAGDCTIAGGMPSGVRPARRRRLCPSRGGRTAGHLGGNVEVPGAQSPVEAALDAEWRREMTLESEL